ncbi:MAG: pyridoxal phosphate-dependent aminotransferase [Spirochaetales bacterium]|jgi:aminotransferase|nr:pyridoxal phosphate-dependent aminotransferase [Spirochaetales bacterium]
MHRKSTHISQYAEHYPASGIRTMFDLLADYPDVVNLCNGEPDFATPAHICEAATSSLQGGDTRYSPTSGILELRQAVADKYTHQFNRSVTVDNVMIVCGGTEALMMSLLTTVDPGDEVIITDPCYPNYFAQIGLVRAKCVSVPVYEENNFLIDPEDLRKAITPRTKGIILNYPNNPLGVTATPDYIQSLEKLIYENNLLVFSDEVYESLTYGKTAHFSIAQNEQIKDNVLVMNSLSKTYSMTGWRIGYIVGHHKIMDSMFRLQESVISCLPVFIQKAALAALTGPQDEVHIMAKAFEKRMNLLVDGLQRIPGFQCIRPMGGLCVMANISAFNMKSEEFSKELLVNAGVMTVPGSAFGHMGEGFIRFCFANSFDNIKKGVERLSSYIASRNK